MFLGRKAKFRQIEGVLDSCVGYTQITEKSLPPRQDKLNPAKFNSPRMSVRNIVELFLTHSEAQHAAAINRV